jgi:hypothetical protein
MQRTQRLVRYAQQMAEKPDASTPSHRPNIGLQCQSPWYLHQSHLVSPDFAAPLTRNLSLDLDI